MVVLYANIMQTHNITVIHAFILRKIIQIYCWVRFQSFQTNTTQTHTPSLAYTNTTHHDHHHTDTATTCGPAAVRI